jgi:asparagine synthase (glutamine-hydrolysing)
MYSGVFAVRASHIISIKESRVSEHDYWRLQDVDVEEGLAEEEYVGRLRETISDAINIRADYPGSYGAIVSGGLDTGIVAAILAKKSGAGELPAFSVAFDEKCFSDDPLQAVMVKEFSLRHHQAVLDPVEFADTLEATVGFLDAPVNDIAFVGMAKVFELVRQQGLRIVFEGEGPDEIFPAGNTHGERELAKFLLIPGLVRRKLLGPFFHTMPLGDSLVDKVTRALTRVAMSDDERQLTWRTYFHNKLRNRLLSPDWHDPSDPYIFQRPYFSICRNCDPVNRYQFLLIKTFLADNLLFKDERMAACRGVVNRVPLIDPRLVELALKIPSRLQLAKPDKCSDGIKLLYKKALHGRLPDALLKHKKVRGFSHPTSPWFRKDLRDFIIDILLGRTTRQRGIFNPGFVEELLYGHLSGKANYDYPLNSLLVFELWMRKHYDELNVGNGRDRV